MKLKVLLLHLVIERNQEQGLSFSLSKQMPEDNCGQAYTAKCSRACIATDVFSCPIVEGHSRPLQLRWDFVETAFNEENSRMVKRFFLNNICYRKSVEDSLGRQFTVWTRNPKPHIDLSLEY
jgi:hypothetical protein